MSSSATTPDTTVLPAPKPSGYCEFDDCPDVEEGAVAKSRCSVCKDYSYCSQKCQKLHWKQHHKWGCSSLVVEKDKAFLEPDPEELKKLEDVVVRWHAAFEKLPRETPSSRAWKASSLPESQELLQLEIPSGSSYTRLPQDHTTYPFRLPLTLIARRFTSEMLSSLSPEARTVLGGYITTCGHNPPKPHFTKIYGPKVVGKPADLAPGEYNFWMTLAPYMTIQDFGVCEFGEWEVRMRALATARVFLWDDRNLNGKK
ncbi:hypothetical protein CC1G_04633 [Coprinopsis cinerea okayama7|uniref:MYND-type domain-containing protein n=1 Tax=Coprinopsis cinerea (strain Okayama-7 / 130 / ATCC MYA-4618 / FGSC 9003) TaxID=240176 RepID=A8N4U4_COPC7|nr:hypothetical protein CC1G_04633 [Coprinopsis cinerea okayama7\|eukprot:XP_001829944.1 hypothetical protein CC1G_04633 [Coprinopsis cinerea okayama7\